MKDEDEFQLFASHFKVSGPVSKVMDLFIFNFQYRAPVYKLMDHINFNQLHLNAHS